VKYAYKACALGFLLAEIRPACINPLIKWKSDFCTCTTLDM